MCVFRAMLYRLPRAIRTDFPEKTCVSKDFNEPDTNDVTKAIRGVLISYDADDLTSVRPG
jgi:hypothetical protein